MKAKYRRSVESITFEGSEIEALGNILEAARQWLEHGTHITKAHVLLSESEIALMQRTLAKAFDALSCEDAP